MNASGRPVVAACQAWVRLREVAAVLLAALALTAVAILNGFPLVEFDSSRYIHSAFTLEVAVDRPVFYSLFIRLSRLVAPTLWATVLLQSLLTALVIHSFLRARVAPRAAGAWTLAVTLALTLLTSVAWYSGYIMADLFTGLMFLAVVTLLVDPHAGWRAALLLAVIAFAVTAHNSNLVILPVFLVVAGCLGRRLLPTPRRAYGAAWAALAVALIAIPLVNASLGAGFRVSRSAHVFLLSRWVGDGAVSKMLDDRCAVADYALCPYRGQLHGLTSGQFLWAPDSPLAAIGGWKDSEAAAWPILRDTLRYRPLAVLGNTLVNVGKQLLVFRTGWNAVAYGEEVAVARAIRRHFPQAYDDWQRSLQQQSRLHAIASAINWVHYPVAAAGLALLLAIALPAGTRWSPAVATTSRFLARAVLLFVLLNATVCAGLAVIYDRYGGRVIWLVPLVALEILRFEWGHRSQPLR